MKLPPLITRDALIGRVLVGRYHIVARIGAGGMGVVYRAWDGPGERYVVVKIPVERAREPEVFLARFGREMEVLRRIDHPHVVPIIDDGTCDGRPFAVMPYLAGGSLALRRPRRDGTVQPGNAALLYRWLPDVASALDHVHALGFVHRDVKPDNILFDGHGRPLVSDFGLARVSDDLVATDPSLTDTGTVLGTPDYMDPHVLQGGAAVPAGDQYALAVVVYEMLAGRRPIVGESPAARMIAQVMQEPQRLRSVRADLPRSVGEAIHRGLAKKADQRFSSCTAFAAAVLAEITPPPALRQRRLMCPACQMLIASADQHGGKLGACPQCRCTVWIAPDLLALVIPADREPIPVAVAESAAAPSADLIAPAEQLEPAPASEPLSRSGLVLALRQSLRSRRTVAAGTVLATAAVGLALVLAPHGPAERPAADGAAREQVAGASPPIIAHDALNVQINDELLPLPRDGQADGAMTDNPGNAPLAAEDSQLAPSESEAVVAAPQPVALAAPAGSGPLAAGLAPETPDLDSRGPSDPQPAGPPRIAAIAIDPAEAVARDIDPLFEEWETSVRAIKQCEKTFDSTNETYEFDVANLNRVSGQIAEFVHKALNLDPLVQQARRGNDAVAFEALIKEQAFNVQQAARLRPRQEEHRQAVLRDQQRLDEINADIAKHYAKITMTLPRWVATVSPFNCNEQSAATLELINEQRTAAERLFDGRWTHLDASVIELHLTTVTAALDAVEKATVDLVDRIEAADAFLRSRRVPDDECRRLLHFHRLHTAYATIHVLAASERVPKKLDDWVRKQDELIQSRPAAFALRGLHELAGGRFATAAKHFDEFLDRRPNDIEFASIARVVAGGAVVHERQYTPAVDEPLNAALRGEIAWFFAAAPAPQARTPDKVRILTDAIPGENPPWQALRAEAELCARENRWEDALSALARAEQRAPRLLAADLQKQRTSYENRRPFTLARKR